MKREHAAQIADLLNSQNQLMIPYTADRVMANEQDYLVELDDDKVAACVEVKKVQWYQFELRHLTVADTRKRQGLARRLLKRSEERAAREGAKILQCTIREGNSASEALFHSAGYQSICRFFNQGSGT